MRLPDFVIIGSMKSGTTSLHEWLGAQQDVYVSPVKEPNFFSHDEIWAKGLGWYSKLFARASEGQLAGEASASYSRSEFSEVAARRIARTLPNVKLIYLVRHPIERLRSHYRHEVQRGRERRSFSDVIQDSQSPYVGPSLYYACLEPYIRTFPREQICVVRFEDLIAEPPAGWSKILSHLGIANRSAPGTAHNVTGDKGQYTRLMLRLWESDVLRLFARFPIPIRRLGKRLLIKRDAEYTRRLAESSGPIPEHVEMRIWSDVRRLDMWLGDGARMWHE